MVKQEHEQDAKRKRRIQVSSVKLAKFEEDEEKRVQFKGTEEYAAQKCTEKEEDRQLLVQ